MERMVLIVVDMLNDFLEEKGALFCGKEAREIIPYVAERLDAARRRGDLILFLQDCHAADDKEFERFPAHAVQGTWGGEVVPELAPRPGERIIPKRRFSGFFETNLDSILAASKVEHVEVVGVCTSICVMDTVGGLANRDYKVTVPASGVADFNADFHQFSLDRMKQVYGATIL